MQPAFGTWNIRGYANVAQPRRADPGTLHQVGGRTMGTTWSVRFGNPQLIPLQSVSDAAEAALASVVTQMSHWEPDSDLGRFNRADAGHWQPLPSEFQRVMRCAIAHAEASGGAFDPTMGALVDAWGFGPRDDGAAPSGRDTPPTAAEIDDARARCGWRRLAFDDQGRLRQPGGLRLDLSGIAKGFSVDRVADALGALGITHCLVEVGGELLARGQRPDGLPWRVAVDTGAGQSQVALPLRGLAIATSGDAWHAFDHEGRRYSHTLDPRSGEPVHHRLASVTVLHAECMQADALATTLTVLGPDDGLAFARERDLPALFVERGAPGTLATPRMTPAFERLLP
jgi:thiamine biosynthesis lipoprotein